MQKGVFSTWDLPVACKAIRSEKRTEKVGKNYEEKVVQVPDWPIKPHRNCDKYAAVTIHLDKSTRAGQMESLLTDRPFVTINKSLKKRPSPRFRIGLVRTGVENQETIGQTMTTNFRGNSQPPCLLI